MHLCPGEKSVIYYIILKKPIHSVRQNGSQLYVLTSKEEGKRTDVPKIIRTIIRITCLGNTRARARSYFAFLLPKSKPFLASFIFTFLGRATGRENVKKTYILPKMFSISDFLPARFYVFNFFGCLLPLRFFNFASSCVRMTNPA